MDFLADVGDTLGITALGIGGKIAYDKHAINKMIEENTSTGDSVLKYEGNDERDQIILKSKKAKKFETKDEEEEETK